MVDLAMDVVSLENQLLAMDVAVALRKIRLCLAASLNCVYASNFYVAFSFRMVIITKRLIICWLGQDFLSLPILYLPFYSPKGVEEYSLLIRTKYVNDSW